MTKNPILYGMTGIYLAFFRVVVSLMMLTHGWPKLLRLFSGEQIEFGDPIGIGPVASLILAVFAEVICSVLIIIGFKTRLATIPLIITMLVVIFVVHLNDDLREKEAAVLYLLSFGLIYFFGAGRYALDNKMK